MMESLEREVSWVGVRVRKAEREERKGLPINPVVYCRSRRRRRKRE